MKKIYAAALVGTFLTMSACTKKDDDETSTASTTEEETKTSEIKTGSGVMAAIGDTLNSLATAAPGTLVVSTGLRLESHASANPLCTEHGEPLAEGVTKSKGDVLADSDRMDHDDPNYASNLFFCLATLNAAEGASVETLLGQIAQTQSILCTFEEVFGAIEYTTAGTDLIDGTNKDATLSTACWPNGTPDGLEKITFTKGLAKLMDESTGYQKDLSFTGTYAMGDETGTVEEQMQFFNKDGIIGFKRISVGDAPGIGGYSEMVMNTNTGVILVNTVDDRNGAGGADSSYRRVVRLKVAGTLDDDLKFSGLDAMQGIYANSGQTLDQYSIVSLKGDKTNGFYGQMVLKNDTRSEVYKGCSGANTSCTTAEINDLVSTETTDATFYNSRTAWAAQLESGLPPCDDGKDLTYAAVPTTGAYGVCE